MKLFTPFTLEGVTLANRVVLTAMVTRLSGEDGHVNQAITDRYLRFAHGEPGLLVLEAMAVHSAKSGPLLRISGPEFVPGLAELARRIHDSSPSKVFPQIIHFLKISRSGWRQRVQDLNASELPVIVEQYAAAAARAREAGMDGVELHMAHAYTLSSFLSRRNSRADPYGGKSLENRLRLPSEVLVRVRAAVGADFPVGIRFDGEECIKGGYSLPDAQQIALRLARLGASYISLSAGGKFEDAIHKAGTPLYPYTGFSGDRCMPGAEYPDAFNVYLPDGVRAALRHAGLSTPVIATGKVGTPDLAEKLLQEGKADLIGMARALLADPDWPRKAREGQADKIVRCVYGNVCKALDENFKEVTCCLWPKGALGAPRSDDLEPPGWPTEGAGLQARRSSGRVELSWRPATDNEGVYGYEIFRAADGGELSHLTSLRGNRHTFSDLGVLQGTTYRYQVRAYDLAGNRSPPSAAVTVSD